jgi:hypothetical protein
MIAETIDTINVELYTVERDFIIELLDYALADDLIDKLQKAPPNKYGILTILLTEFDVQELIRNLRVEAHRHEERSAREDAHQLAETLEAYDFQRQKVNVH